MDLYLLMIILDRNNLTPPDQLFRGKSYFVTPVFRSALPRVLTHRFMIDCKAVDADILTFPWFDADSAEGLRRGRGGMTRTERERVGLAWLRRPKVTIGFEERGNGCDVLNGGKGWFTLRWTLDSAVAGLPTNWVHVNSKRGERGGCLVEFGKIKSNLISLFRTNHNHQRLKWEVRLRRGSWRLPPRWVGPL